MLQFRDIEDVISYYKALVRTRKDLLQSQWWNRQLMEQSKVLQQQIRAEKEAEMLQCKNDLVQLKESFDQAQSDIRQWVKSCEVAGGALQGLAESGVAAASSCSQGLMAGPSSRVCAVRRCLIPSLQERGGRAHVCVEQVCHEEELEAAAGLGGDSGSAAAGDLSLLWGRHSPGREDMPG